MNPSIWDIITFLLVPIALAGGGWLRSQIKDTKADRESGEKILWDEIGKLREEIAYIREHYARRDDLENHLRRLETGQDRLGDKVDRMTESIVKPLTDLAAAIANR